jgi:FdhD protein
MAADQLGVDAGRTGVTGTAAGPTGVAAIRRSVSPVRIVGVRPGRHLELPDQVVTEEPMEIRAAGPHQLPEAVAVTMRTPGHDFELAAGYLLTEGLVQPAEVAAVKYCELEDGEEQRFNVVTVSLTRPFDPGQFQRNFGMTSSCGICGKASLDQVEVKCATLPPSPDGGLVPASLIPTLPDRLREAQRLFDQTGGLHAAALFDTTGQLHCLREDVGRHNAVDKVIGHAVLHRTLPLDERILMVSGRVSFEIVQKAAMASVAVLAAVSAPSSLAVDAGERLGVTVAAFVRNDTYNVYSHPERLDFNR